MPSNREAYPFYPYMIANLFDHPFAVRNVITGVMEFGANTKEDALRWIAAGLSEKLEESQAKEFDRIPIAKIATQIKRDVKVRATTQTLEFGDHKLPVIILEVVPDA